MSETPVPVGAALGVGASLGLGLPVGDTGRAEDLPRPWLPTAPSGTEEDEALARSPARGRR